MTSLDEKIDHALDANRILNDTFTTMPEWLRDLHMASLASAGVSTILLMAPAAYHRIVEEGEDSERVLRFTSVMLLAAMGFLGLGISGDTIVVVGKVTESPSLAVGCGFATLRLSLLLWFGFSLYRRRRYRAG